MKSYVITIFDNPRSVQVADRCISSGKALGIDIEKFVAITPKQEIMAMANHEGIPTSGFKEIYSRFDNCLSAFLSHYSLWKMCVQDNEEYQIFEHDAVIVNQLPPETLSYKGLVNLGKPSYGKYNDPQMIGVNPLTSKNYLPGAHAYRIKPWAAQELIDKAKSSAMPTDVFIHIQNFPWLEEYYPWPVEVRDNFTTIQNQRGCLAKHNYKNGLAYDII